MKKQVKTWFINKFETIEEHTVFFPLFLIAVSLFFFGVLPPFGTITTPFGTITFHSNVLLGKILYGVFLLFTGGYTVLFILSCIVVEYIVKKGGKQ